jgi:hypothetical protein
MTIDDAFEAVDKQYPKDEPNIPKVVSEIAGAALTLATLSGVPHLAVPSAVVAAWNRVTSRNDWRNRTEETLALLVERLGRLEPEYDQIEKEQKELRVDIEDLKSSIQLAIVSDASAFNDRKRERFVGAIARATVFPSRVRDLVSFIQDIDQLNESDITALKVLNAVMNKDGDWREVNRTAVGLHPNTFLQRRQELAIQMALALGKTSSQTHGNTFSREEGLGLCLRLQGFGMAEVINSEARSVPITDYCARLTPRGLMLLLLLDENVPNWDKYFEESGPV